MFEIYTTNDYKHVYYILISDIKRCLLRHDRSTNSPVFLSDLSGEKVSDKHVWRNIY